MTEYHEVALTNKKFQDLNPFSFGYEDCKPTNVFGPYVRGYFLIHYVTRGKGKFIIDNKCYNVEKEHMFIIPPEKATFYSATPDEPWSYIWIGFDGKLSEDFRKLGDVVHFPTDIFFEMMQCEHYNSAREEFLLSKLYQLYSDLFDNTLVPGDYVQKARDYIDTRYMENVHINEIAKIIGVDRTYLSKLFTEKTGMNMQKYLIEVRLRHAAEYLKSGYSVSESSAMCGYEDVFNFSRMFKKHYGVSPKEMKKPKTK